MELAAKTYPPKPPKRSSSFRALDLMEEDGDTSGFSTWSSAGSYRKTFADSLGRRGRRLRSFLGKWYSEGGSSAGDVTCLAHERVEAGGGVAYAPPPLVLPSTLSPQAAAAVPITHCGESTEAVFVDVDAAGSRNTTLSRRPRGAEATGVTPWLPVTLEDMVERAVSEVPRPVGPPQSGGRGSRSCSAGPGEKVHCRYSYEADSGYETLAPPPKSAWRKRYQKDRTEAVIAGMRSALSGVDAVLAADGYVHYDRLSVLPAPPREKPPPPPPPPPKMPSRSRSFRAERPAMMPPRKRCPTPEANDRASSAPPQQQQRQRHRHNWNAPPLFPARRHR